MRPVRSIPIVTVTLLAVCSAAQALAAPRPPDVQVCVRIEKKAWTHEGVAPRPASVAAPVPAPSGVEPQRPPDAVSGTAEREVASGDQRWGELPPAVFTQPPTGPEAPPAAPAPTVAPPGGDLLPEDEAALADVDPELYLRRLVEYHVTHEPGFESTREGCTQTLTVELYPVRRGFTIFARYTGSAREEKVDVVRLDELGTFAERVTLALLRDRSIAQTLTRTTVLRADSETEVRQVHTRAHFLLGMGSGARLGELPTAPDGTGAATPTWRVETPLGFSIGARNKFRGWALDATGRVQAGFTERASWRNPGGGHVDYSLGLGFGLGFLAYADPDAVNTAYYGAGGSFEVSRYQTIGAKGADGAQPLPGSLWGGGLSVDAILGYEFMRASTLHFFVQGVLSAPAYLFEAENEQARVRSYIPAAAAQVGLLF